MASAEIDSGLVTITAHQIRAARAILGWSQSEAAKKFGIARASLAPMERGETIPRRSNVARMIEVLADHGISLANDDHGFTITASFAALKGDV